jgi:hypothetical protein
LYITVVLYTYRKSQQKRTTEASLIATKDLIRQNRRYAKLRWGGRLGCIALRALKAFTEQFQFSVADGDFLLESGWYVTHSGLISLARRKRCVGIKVQPIQDFCEPSAQRWTFEATVYKTKACRGFVGYGDADPSNVSSVVRGAEMRVAETRAVNRALRKAYGIGICSVEEIGTTPNPIEKLPPQKANGNGNGSGPKVRDRLCQLIRQYKLDPALVKAYAVDFCGTKTLREASREQIESFIQQLADWAKKDRNALICQLNSYFPPEQKVVV